MQGPVFPFVFLKCVKIIFKFAFMGKFLQLYRFVRYYDFRPTNPIGWPQPQPSTRLAQQHRLRPVEAEVETEVEAGWGKLRPSLLGWTLLDDLNSGLRQVEGWSSVLFWPSQWTHHCIAIHDLTARLRQDYKAEFQLDFDLHSENITV